MKRIIRIIIISTILLLATSLLYADEPDATVEKSDDGIILAVIGSTVPILGLWLTYKTNTAKREKKETDRDLKQDEALQVMFTSIADMKEEVSTSMAEMRGDINTLSVKVEIQSETNETNIAVKKLKYRLDQTSSILLSGMDDIAVKELVVLGIDKINNVLSGVLIQEFILEPSTVALQLNVAIKQVLSFYPNGSKLCKDSNIELREKILRSISHTIQKFIIELHIISAFNNGVRRGKFIKRSIELMEDIILVALDLYKTTIYEESTKASI